MADRRRSLTKERGLRFFIGAFVLLLAGCGGGLEPSALPPPAGPAPAGGDAAAAPDWLAALPAGTRAIARLEGALLEWVWSLREMRLIAESAARCRVDLAKDVRTIDVALAEPFELSIDVDADVTLDDARCMFSPDPSAEGAVRHGPLVIVPRAGGGIRAATPAALRGGSGAPPDLAMRWRDASARGSAIVGRLDDEGQAWLEASWGGEARAVITVGARAAPAAALMVTSVATLAAQGAVPSGFEARAEGDLLVLRWDTPLAADLVAVLRERLITAAAIESSSMNPTLLPGDIVALTPPVGPPRRGEVASYRVDGKQGTFIGRVVGLGGERLRIDGRSISIDGSPIVTNLVDPTYTSPDFDARSPEPPAELWEEVLDERAHDMLLSQRGFGAQDGQVLDVRVPKGQVFLLGDHRDNTLDSRRLGPVPEDRLGWRPRVTLLSLSPQGALRWERTLAPIE